MLNVIRRNSGFSRGTGGLGKDKKIHVNHDARNRKHTSKNGCKFGKSSKLVVLRAIEKKMNMNWQIF